MEILFGFIVLLSEIYIIKEFDNKFLFDVICDNVYDLIFKGIFDNWFNMYLKEVKGFFFLELVVVFGIFVLVMSFLKYKYEIEFVGIIFSFIG